jgi:hypothetical protein
VTAKSDVSKSCRSQAGCPEYQDAPHKLTMRAPEDWASSRNAFVRCSSIGRLLTGSQPGRSTLPAEAGKWHLASSDLRLYQVLGLLIVIYSIYRGCPLTCNSLDAYSE